MVMTTPRTAATMTEPGSESAILLGAVCSTECGATDDGQFGALNEHCRAAVLHQVPGYDRGEDHQDANNCEHNDSLSESYPLPYEGGSLSAFVLQNLNLLPNFVA